jgi:hypothetical protein
MRDEMREPRLSHNSIVDVLCVLTKLLYLYLFLMLNRKFPNNTFEDVLIAVGGDYRRAYMYFAGKKA